MSPAAPLGAAVVGYAHSQIVRRSDDPLGALTLEVAQQAIADAGLSPDDIDGFSSSSLTPSAGSHPEIDGVSTVSSTWLAQHLGCAPTFCSGFQGHGQLPGAVGLAVSAIASGAARHVLVHRAMHNPAGSYHRSSMSSASGGAQWIAPQGFFGPLAMIGMTYQEYLQRHSAPREAMAGVVVESRKNGARIPWSVWKDQPLSFEDYLDSPMLTDPICRLDCDMPVHGAAAFVLTSAERAADLPHRPVHVTGIASTAPTRWRLPQHWPLDDLYEAGAAIRDRLRQVTGLDPTEVDLPQVYDGFSSLVYIWLEVLGFCGNGEAHELVADGGIDSDDPTALPVLSGGGALGNGRMHGIPQMLECYLQLSGRAGDRQRTASTALACHAAPHVGGVIAFASDTR